MKKQTIRKTKQILALCLLEFLFVNLLLFQIVPVYGYTEVSTLHFEEGEGTTVSDNYTWDMYRDDKIEWVSGRIGDYGLEFDHNQRCCLYRGDTPEFNLDVFSIAVWLNISRVDAWGVIYQNWIWNSTAGTDYYFGIYMSIQSGTGKVRVLIGDGTTSISVNNFGDDYRDGNWYHVVLTYDGSVARVYIDTVYIDSLTSDIAYQYLNYSDSPWSDGIKIGGDNVSFNSLNAIFDDFYLTSTVLTAQEIQDLFEAGQPETAQETISSNLELAAGIMISLFILVFLMHMIYMIDSGKSQQFIQLLFGYVISAIILCALALIMLII